jgi:tetratricopeptide (TPR) repeat protein
MKKILILILLCISFVSSTAILYPAEQQSDSTKQAKKDVEKYPNKSLVQAAWDAYNIKDYDSALAYADRCIALYDVHARKLQASLTGPIPDNKINSYWVLNDVATAKFIKGKVLWARKDGEGAKRILTDIAQNYSYAMAYDLRGWHWSLANAAKDMIKAIDLGVDFGDSSSSFLTTKAWESYNVKDYKATLGFAEQCIKMYKEAALWQQKSLRKYPKKEEIPKYWALNDVATCCYLAGKAYKKLGDSKKAKEYFDFVKYDLYYGSCWDPKGWYWKVADAIKKGQ